eukprot:TRINITY_DN2481_c1_g1_i9.p1 TRINITY_DN2481_c1_g1~~TRINITY_DN2481_c1_g1_i9.p1  ORF type:complete len:252 (-),score=40.26 TRINITY_DN2481_c1_g1_i9:192-947(-)
MTYATHVLFLLGLATYQIASEEAEFIPDVSLLQAHVNMSVVMDEFEDDDEEGLDLPSEESTLLELDTTTPLKANTTVPKECRGNIARRVRNQDICGRAALTDAEKQQMLERHNLYRCMHDVDLMTWDDSIAETAQTWADGGVFKHSRSGNGENIAWGYKTVNRVVDAWYEEILDTNGGLVTKYSANIGHYTQIVWATSVKLGCGLGAYKHKKKLRPYWVCQYSPRGNIVGHFADQVKAPVKTEAECKGVSR